jgi:hypothetical protein
MVVRMQKYQFDSLVKQDHQQSQSIPKIFVVGCAELSSYQLAVEVNQQLEMIQIHDKPLAYSSLEQLKNDLIVLGLQRVFLRLYNPNQAQQTTQSCAEQSAFYDIELSLSNYF